MTALLVAGWVSGVMTEAGCATGATVAVEAPASLEVVNRTLDLLWIELRGQVVAEVPSGQRRRVHGLTSGDHRVVARARRSPSRVGPFTARPPMTRDVALAAGDMGRVDFVRDEDGVPEPAPLATLVIESRLKEDVQVRMDGRPLGTVLAGDTRTFRDVRAGEHVLRAADVALVNVFDEHTVLSPDEATVWTLAAPTTALEVVNDTPEAVQVVVGSAGETVRVEPQDRHVLEGLTAGRHLIVATAVVTGRRYERRAVLQAGFRETWELTAGRAALALDNQSGQTVTVRGLGPEALTLAPGDAHVASGLPPGRLVVEVDGEDGRSTWLRELSLAPDQAYRWRLDPVPDALRVTNHTSHELHLYVNGVPRGLLRSETTTVLDALPGGDLVLRAVTLDGRRAFQRRLDAQARAGAGGGTAATAGGDGLPVTEEWDIRPTVGAVEIDNRRREPVTIFADARLLGEVGPKQRLVFTGVEQGRVLIEVVAEATGDRIRHTLFVVPGSPGHLRVTDPTGVVSVANLTGEELIASGLMGKQHPRVPVDARVEFTLAAGLKRLSLVGSSSGLPYTRDVQVVPDGRAAWTLEPAVGSLAVRNALEGTARVLLAGDEANAILLEPGREHVFGPMPAGVQVVRAELLGQGRVLEARRFVAPDGLVRWTLRQRQARLRVDNQAREAIDVRLDGEVYGRVEPGGRTIFGDLTGGTRRLHVTGTDSGRTQTAVVKLEAERDEVFVVPAWTGTLELVNRSGERVALYAGDARIADLAQGEASRVTLDVGPQLVEARREPSGDRTVHLIRVLAGHRAALTVPPMAVQLTATNRTKAALMLFMGQRALGRLEPGASMPIAEVLPGRYTLEATDLEGRRTHTERRTLSAGETASWELIGGVEASEAGAPDATPGDAGGE